MVFEAPDSLLISKRLLTYHFRQRIRAKEPGKESFRDFLEPRDKIKGFLSRGYKQKRREVSV